MRHTDRFAAITLPVFLLMLQQLLAGIVVAPASTFFPVYLKDLGWSALMISAIATVQRVAGLASSLIGGTLSDSIGPKRTLVLGQACYFAATLLFVARAPFPVAVIWAACGFGMGLTTLGGQSYLMENADHAFLGVLTALYYWGYTLGGAAANPVAGLLLGRRGYPFLTLATAVPAVATVLLTAVFLPRSRKEAAPAAAADPDRRRGFLGYGRIGRRPEVLMLAMLRFLPTFCYGMAGVFVPLLLKAAGASNGLIALYATVSSIVAALAQLAAGRLADSLDWKAPTVTAFLLLGLGALAIALFPGSLPVVFAGAVVLLAAAWSLSALMPTLVSKVTVPAERGRVLGFAHLFWNMAMILGSLTGGFLYVTRPGLPFAAGAAAVAAAIALAFAFFRLVDRRATAGLPDLP